MLFIVLAVIYLLYLLFIYVQHFLSKPGSDHYYHIGLINNIRQNRNRFISNHSQLIDEKNFFYPQFVHWCLSFFTVSKIDRISKLLNSALGLINLSIYLVFSYIVFLIFAPSISLEKWILYNGILYLLTPFFYSYWNAKNTGISARGVGFFLGSTYIILNALFAHFGYPYFYLLTVLTSFIILISSQFAFQYIVFSSPFLAILYADFLLFLPPMIAIALFFVLMPKVAKNWIKGQYWHKYIYSRYLSKVFLLNKRYSIWRDLVYDFWIEIKKDLKMGLWYLYNNPILNIIKGFPLLIVLILYFVKTGFSDINENTNFLLVPIIISLAIFFLTSFRFSRFLGEPERYVEFAVPFITVVGALLFYDSMIIYVIIGISIGLITVELIVSYFIGKVRYEDLSNEILNFKEIILNNRDDKEVRLFSNHIAILKFFLDTLPVKILFTNLSSLHTGPFKFSELYPVNYPIIADEVIIPLIKHFKINWFIHDTKMGFNTSLLEKDLGFQRIAVQDRLILLKRKESA